MRVSAGQAVKYAVMPGIFPRLKDLFLGGFGPVTQLVALVCFMCGLLPRTHPCFNRKTSSQYGLIRILAEAGNAVKFEWKNSDQVIIYTALLCGTVMLFLYLVGLVLFVMVSPAMALGALMPSIFETQYPDHDIAFMMLDRTFGLPGVFDSCVSTGASCYTGPNPPANPPVIPFPSPFHLALHELFRFYSMGIFFIALFVFLYHIVMIVYDVTQTGKVTEHLSDGDESSGQNFGWLPIRFVLAFGLLLPFGDGLNSAQWIMLYTAKFGSGLATNAWIQYNDITGDNPTGEENARLVAQPNQLDTSGLIKSLLLLRACRNIHTEMQGINTLTPVSNVDVYAVNGSSSFSVLSSPYSSSASGIAGANASDSFIKILDFSGMSDIRLVIGAYDKDNPKRYDNYPGGILPVCGEVVIPVTGRTGEALFAAEGNLFAVLSVLANPGENVGRPSYTMSNFEVNVYVAATREFNRISSDIKRNMRAPYTVDPRECFWDWFWNNHDGYETAVPGDSGQYLGNCKEAVPTSYWNKLLNDYYKPLFGVPPLSAYDFLAGTSTATSYDPRYPIGNTAWNAVGVDNPLLMTTGILEYGWGGAGLWYNKISERNGSLYTASVSIPTISKFPLVMEQISESRKKTDPKSSATFCENYNPRKSGTGSIYLPSEKDQFTTELATALHSLCDALIGNENVALEGVGRSSGANNAVEGAIRAIFSEFKPFDLEKNYEVTPMAQMSAIGRMLVDKSILAIMGSAAASAIGGAMHMMNAKSDFNTQMEAMADFAGASAGLLMTFATLGLTAGAMLHYVLPYMPFVYFFFAVGRWVKTIFEALVGAPLWAFAHMRTGGAGLPGDAASGGYFLILEIFFRPIVTVFSLIGAFAIFSAMALGLNAVFTLAATNFLGAPPAASLPANPIFLARGVVDQFFLTVFYVGFIYLIGTGCFKLIDLIPDNIMRWTGAGVSSIGAADTSDDLLDTFEYQMPQRLEGMFKEAGGVFKEALYNPGKAAANEAKAAAAQAEKAKQAAAAKNQADGGGE